VRLCFAEFLQVLDVPEVHLASKVPEPAKQYHLVEGADPYCVAEALAEFKRGLAVLVIQRRCSRLKTSNHNEVLASWQPASIVNLIVENRNVLAVAASENLSVLKSVFSVVALSTCIKKVLRPNQSRISFGTDKSSDFLSPWALDHEFGPINISLSDIIEVYSSIGFFF
jgi:hypothetical protein